MINEYFYFFYGSDNMLNLLQKKIKRMKTAACSFFTCTPLTAVQTSACGGLRPHKKMRLEKHKREKISSQDWEVIVLE